MTLVECWNTIGDLGAATRSSDRKRAEVDELAVALGGDAGRVEVGTCWVIRDTEANRALLARYPHIFVSRFPGSSIGWLRVLTMGGPMPSDPALVWCDLAAQRLFARRPPRP